MATEEILFNGQKILTLKELLRTGLKCVFVGLNPAPESVRRGHYYQGRLGQRLWNRLVEHRILPPLPQGAEDDAAFVHGFGFADLVRRPTASSRELPQKEKLEGVADLRERLRETGDRPRLVFTFKEAWDYAGAPLEQAGYCVYKMPGPYMKKELADALIADLRNALGTG